MSDRKLLPGKFVWFEHVSKNPKQAQDFYANVLGWKVKSFAMSNIAYEMILTGDTWDTMIGGYAAAEGDRVPSHWIATVSVEDVDAAAKAAIANGGKVLDGPSDLPGVGRRARIADTQGAEPGLLTGAKGDKPDAPATSGDCSGTSCTPPSRRRRSRSTRRSSGSPTTRWTWAPAGSTTSCPGMASTAAV